MLTSPASIGPKGESIPHCNIMPEFLPVCWSQSWNVLMVSVYFLCSSGQEAVYFLLCLKCYPTCFPQPVSQKEKKETLFFSFFFTPLPIHTSLSVNTSDSNPPTPTPHLSTWAFLKYKSRAIKSPFHIHFAEWVQEFFQHLSVHTFSRRVAMSDMFRNAQSSSNEGGANVQNSQRHFRAQLIPLLS